MFSPPAFQSASSLRVGGCAAGLYGQLQVWSWIPRIKGGVIWLGGSESYQRRFPHARPRVHDEHWARTSARLRLVKRGVSSVTMARLPAVPPRKSFVDIENLVYVELPKAKCCPHPNEAGPTTWRYPAGS